MIIAIVNQKGGVGKTTTTVNLSAALAETGARVLVIDLDSQANATEMLGASRARDSIFDVLVDNQSVPLSSIIRDTPIERVWIAPGHRALAGLESALRDIIGKEMLLRETLAGVTNDYEFIVVDNGPALNIAPAMALVAADVAIVPVACEPLAIAGLTQITKSIDMARDRLNPRMRRRILLTMLNNRTSHGKQIAASTRQRFDGEVFETTIQESAHLQRGLTNKSSGGSVLGYASHSGPAQWFRDLALEVKALQGEGDRG